MISVLAVYENGVLRPKEPLALADGQEVQLSVHPRTPSLPRKPPTPEEEDYARRIKAARTLAEMFAVMETAPPSEEDFDVVRAMNETRRLTGFRMPDPEPGEEDPVE
jgi:predicted DNA-binding antitoxin AbrB/MazE fold protein